ncbi:hypothetical protein N7495_001221 [Penicillium taxi]|uniref:uncharacterized protein n=1 Tax=Penicillium taxi TaxID=168475 RepID=UPI0025450285|nr:uncharacterized protein N7495_001221 [Penicillium taxi]KAJ5908539.1 hypothetical protein N7495_001221 [Penicillium taxi]
MAKFSFLLLAGWAVKLAAAKDVYLDWNVTWVNAAPDGFERPVIGINGQWPCPQIDVDVGDRLIVDVYNDLGNQSTGIHWHGFHQYHSGVMDGDSQVTQCPLAPGLRMQYHFDINQTGTYWYHSHNMGQYPDGFRGPLIVHDPKAPFQYDDEFTITLTDWYHEQMADLLADYQSEKDGAAFDGHEPLPHSALINDSNETKIKVEPNKTYLVHIVCVGNWPGHTWVFDGHEMTVVEVDGVYVEPYLAGDKFFRIATGQRMSVLIHTKNDTSQNFAIWDTMDINMMFIFENRTIPDGYNPNATAWLVYDESKPLPAAPVFSEFEFIDDLDFVPLDKGALLEPVQHQIIIDSFSANIDGIPRFTVNNKTYLPPKVPTLYTANTIGPEFASNPDVYGQVNPFVVKYGEVVEIVINNHHGNLHPWHLHGHEFQVLQRSAVDGGYFTGQYVNVSQTPVRRDTIMVQNHGHVVLRFRADNPGVWLLHCHIEWHVEAGLMATIIEAPETFPGTQHAPPKSHYDACAAYPDPTNGNAAGNAGLDLTGLDTKVPTVDHGAMYTPPSPTTSVSTEDDSTWATPPPASTKTSSTTEKVPPTLTTTTSSATKQAPPPPAHTSSSLQPAAPQSITTQKPHGAKPSATEPATQAPAPKPTTEETPAPKPTVSQPAPEQVAPSQPSANEEVVPKPTVVPKPESEGIVPVIPTVLVPFATVPNPKPVQPTTSDEWAFPTAEAATPDDGNYGVVSGYPDFNGVPQDAPEGETIAADSEETKGPSSQSQTDKSHAQDGDTTADSQDSKGNWPSPNTDKSDAHVGGGHGDKPIQAHNEDTKGLWPNGYTNDGYVVNGGHKYQTHDSG